MLDLPEGRSSHDAVVIGNKLIVVGGWKLNGRGKPTEWHDTTLMLDLDKPARWESVKQPFKRRALTTAAHQGRVYVLGGMNDESKTVLTVSIFDPAQGTWSAGPEIPSPRRNGFSPGGRSAGGVLYVTPSDGRVLALGGKQDVWAEVGQLQQPRIVHRMVPAGDDRLVVLGGAAGGDNIALTEVVSLRNQR